MILNKYNNLHNVKIIHNPNNVYVNKAWQQAVDYFLGHDEYDNLIIMNSDLIMQKNWAQILRLRLDANPNEIIIPNIINDKSFNEIDTNNIDINECIIVDNGTPGVFICLNREQVKIISPLPHDCCKIWFGDEFLYTILRSIGYVTVIPKNLHAYHSWSANVSILKEAAEIIEEDKKQWELVGRPRMNNIIKGKV